jgi:hypothetical protein
MATSFNTGFKLGSDMFTQAQRNRLAEEELGLARERDARAAEEFGWRRDAESRQRAKDAEVDSLTQQLTRPNAENYALAPGGGATGLGMRGSMPPAMGDTAGVAPTGLRMPAQGDAAPATGLRAPTMPDRPLTFNQAPTGAAAEDILGRIALTRGDTAGFRGSQAAARGFREDDIFRDRLKEFKGTPEQIGSTMSYLNQNSRSVTMGKPDKDGFVQLSVVKPDGDAAFARLTKQDQAKLYAAAGLMEVNPQRAFDMMAQVNKELAAAIAVENGLNVDMTKAGNDAASKRGTLSKQQEELRLKGEELGIKRGQAEATAQYYRDRSNTERMGAAQYFTGQDGNTYASVPRMGKNGLTFETVQVNPQGVKMSKVGGSGADMKPMDVKEEGTKVTVGGRLMYADGLGGFIPGGANGKPAGVLPSDRASVLKKAGVPDNVIDRLEWNKDGTAVGLNGMRFGLDELKNIKTEFERLGRNNIKVDEYLKSSMGLHSASNRMRNAPPEPVSTTGFGPTITYRPDPNAPSIYAGPEEWEAYRRFQQTR